jgi:hypothetical protein
MANYQYFGSHLDELKEPKLLNIDSIPHGDNKAIISLKVLSPKNRQQMIAKNYQKIRKNTKTTYFPHIMQKIPD